jgi:hypothetical protein
MSRRKSLIVSHGKHGVPKDHPDRKGLAARVKSHRNLRRYNTVGHKWIVVFATLSGDHYPHSYRYEVDLGLGSGRVD